VYEDWNQMKWRETRTETGEMNSLGQVRNTYPLYDDKMKRDMAEMNKILLKILWTEETVDTTH